MKTATVAACLCLGLGTLEGCVAVTHTGDGGADAGPGAPAGDAHTGMDPDAGRAPERDGGSRHVVEASMPDSSHPADSAVSHEAGEASHDSGAPPDSGHGDAASAKDAGVPADATSPKDSGISCTAGLSLCGGSCVDTQTDTDHCGACSTICPGVADGTASCGGGSCGFACDMGYHACGATCADDSSVDTCGSSCSPCVAPWNATATCSGTTCGFTCNAGTVSCAGGTACCTTSTIAGGEQHTCVLTPGGLECAGAGSLGQLGDGTTSTCSVPCTPSTSVTPISVVAGNSHTCALSSSGTMQCWGDGTSGDLGDGSTVQKNKPANVTGLSSVVGMAAGYSHTCAALAGGSVECWGDNSTGQLGTGSTTSASTPQLVSGLSGVVAVSAGYSHSCAVTSGGEVWCWGDNSSGAVGISPCSATPSESPVAVPGLSGVTAVVAAANFTCALASGGAVWCWGADVVGEMGTGTFSLSCSAPSAIPTTSFGGEIVVALSASAGGVHVCALTSAGHVWCWGYNADGQLGDGSTTNRASPVKASLPAGATATAIGTGAFHTCAAVTGGTAPYYCWGDGANDQLGDGSTTSPEKKPFGTLF